MAVNDLQHVEKCIEDGALSKLLQLPSTLDDFSEASLIRSMGFFLKASEKQIVLATKDLSNDAIQKNLSWTKNKSSSPFSNRRCYAINIMLKQRFSPQFLQEAARSLPFDCVLSLIKYLHTVLLWLPAVPNKNESAPSLEHIIDWLNALLDSHVQQLKLAEDATEVVQTLYEQVTLMTKWQLETKALLGALAELNRQVEEQQRNTKMGNYCIEVISF
ncbi:nucleolar protein 11 isoform X2 [Aplysia californica]|uniref:Nucleolar protein 11 isoform X2 n=1 Tax=Aplysia californica TaxID=6500 RepID=A0ABM0JHN7_APLCA|nr:nucleolar protein 11 isoform X2 [Aplysia californica]